MLLEEIVLAACWWSKGSGEGSMPWPSSPCSVSVNRLQGPTVGFVGCHAFQGHCTASKRLPGAWDVIALTTLLAPVSALHCGQPFRPGIHGDRGPGASLALSPGRGCTGWPLPCAPHCSPPRVLRPAWPHVPPGVMPPWPHPPPMPLGCCECLQVKVYRAVGFEGSPRWRRTPRISLPLPVPLCPVLLQ